LIRFFRNLFFLLKISVKTYIAQNTKGKLHSHCLSISEEISAEVENRLSQKIPESSLKKIVWYQVSAIFMVDLLCQVNQIDFKKLNHKIYIYLGALIAIADTLVDDYKLNTKQISTIFNDKNHSPSSPLELSVQLIKDKLHNELPNPKTDPIAESIDLLHFQCDSIEQFKPDSTKERILEITENKGGASVLFCQRSLNPTNSQQTKALFQFGALIQYLNDAQDLHKDLQEGITTFTRYSTEFSEIIDFIDLKSQKTIAAVESAFKKTMSRDYFLFCIHAMTIGMNFKLHQYAKACNNELDFQKIKEMDKECFRVNPISWKGLKYCLPKILKF